MFIVSMNPELLEGDNVVVARLEYSSDCMNALNTIFCYVFKIPANKK